MGKGWGVGLGGVGCLGRHGVGQGYGKYGLGSGGVGWGG